MSAALPDHDVLAGDLGRTAVTRNAENENADIPGDIVAGMDLDGMNIIDLQIYGALPEGLNGGTAIDSLSTWWENSGVFAVEAGDGCGISGIEGGDKFGRGFFDMRAGLAGHGRCRQQAHEREYNEQSFHAFPLLLRCPIADGL